MNVILPGKNRLERKHNSGKLTARCDGIQRPHRLSRIHGYVENNAVTAVSGELLFPACDLRPEIHLIEIQLQKLPLHFLLKFLRCFCPELCQPPAGRKQRVLRLLCLQKLSLPERLVIGKLLQALPLLFQGSLNALQRSAVLIL